MTTKAQTSPRKHHRPDGIPRLTACEFDDWLARQPEPALVLFDASWSAACRIELDVFSFLAAHFAGRVRVGVVDASAFMDASRRFGVGWVPTLILYHAGCEVARWEGARGLPDLILDIESALTLVSPARVAEGAPAPSKRRAAPGSIPPAHRTKRGSR